MKGGDGGVRIGALAEGTMPALLAAPCMPTSLHMHDVPKGMACVQVWVGLGVGLGGWMRREEPW